jgi:hypothetical protein
LITIRLTQKLRKFLGVEFQETLQPTSAALGDWYANLVPTWAGEMIVFISDKSLLVVAVPFWEVADLIPLFVLRVANLMGMIGVSMEAAADEITHYREVQYAKTASRSVLGSLNDFAFNIQMYSEDASEENPMSLSDTELRLSHYPCKPLGWKSPAEVARELLGQRGKQDRHYL